MSWRSSSHIIAIIAIQVIIIILFSLFVRYDTDTAQRRRNSIKDADNMIKDTYGMFQDVHVMIFLGFGFLMTFLKRYGLSAVSLNMLCSALAIEVFTLVYGAFHPHCQDPQFTYGSEDCTSLWPVIDVNLVTLLSADFSTAAVLISFGVVLGVTSPLQLVVMTVMEVVIFTVNEVIGRTYLGAVDAGDTIFVHLFGAYFGLTVARVLYHPGQARSDKEGSSYTSDLFSMVGTLFLWCFWPSFNSGAAAPGDAQMRAVVNTYYSLCSCVLASFAFSALVNPSKKFQMDHLQNATLAGGVAVGACADMIITPGGSLAVGAVAGVLSVCGFHYVQPLLLEKLKVHDSCGVNNLHGMPAILGGLLSALVAGLASHDTYDKFGGDLEIENSSLVEIFPSLATGSTPARQALSQVLAMLCTLSFALVGGLVTGMLMHVVGKVDKVEVEELYNDERNMEGLEAEEKNVSNEMVSLMDDCMSGKA